MKGVSIVRNFQMISIKYFRFRFYTILNFLLLIFIFIIILLKSKNLNYKIQLKKVNSIFNKENFKEKFQWIKNLENKSNLIILPESEIELFDGITEEAKRFINELNLINPGENGTAVKLNEKLLTDEHKRLIKQGMDEYGSNVFVSNLISVNRIVSDNRSKECKNKIYRKDLPKASVVVAFYNEPWSVLIRFLHSILINTPEHLLEEIVLVDDSSDKENLQEQLEEYLKKLKKVKLVRSHKRMGVAGGRVFSFVNAKGPILINLDSHMEVAPGWIGLFNLIMFLC